MKTFAAVRHLYSAPEKDKQVCRTAIITFGFASSKPKLAILYALAVDLLHPEQ